MDNIQAQINLFLNKDKPNEESYLRLAQLAAVPLLLSPDLLYKLWRNFKSYTNSEGKNSSTPHLVVSDLLLSNFCRPVGYQLYKLEEEVRLHLLKGLSKPQKNEIATFLEQYAIKSFSPSEKNIQNIHLRLAKSYLRQEEFIDEIKTDLLNKDKKSLEKSHLLNLYYQLEAQADDSNGLSLNLVLAQNEIKDVLEIERRFLGGRFDSVIDNQQLNISKYLTNIPKLTENFRHLDKYAIEINEMFQSDKVNVINILAGTARGKTVLANHYLERYKSTYKHILWIESRAPILATISLIAKNLDLKIPIETKKQDAINLLINNLKELPSKCLVVIDDMDLSILKGIDFRNRLTNFDILTTSRNDLPFSDHHFTFEAEKLLYIEGKNSKKLVIKNDIFIEKLTLNSSKVENFRLLGLSNLKLVTINRSNIKVINITYTSTLNALIINDTNVESMILKGSENLKSLMLNNSSLGEISPKKCFTHLIEVVFINSNFNFVLDGSIESIEKLIINNSNLESVENLGKFKKIDYLDLKNNNITAFDFKLLNDLSNLDLLYLQGNPITNIPKDIFDIEGNCLPELKKWQNKETLVNQQIKEIEEAFNKKIERIPKVDININDGYCLNDDNEIWYLSVYGGNCQDLSVLTNLTSLKKLSLNDMQIRDISPLQNLAQLTVISLQNNQIEDISALQNLNLLESIYLNNNQIRAIPDFSELTYLKILTARENQITDISGIQYLTNLSHLDLHNNQISDISPLKRLKGLDLLQLNFNKIEDITPLKDLIQIRSIFLNNNNIIDISLLGNLENLTSLSISNNQITDIDIVVNLKNLIFFHAENNEIEFFPNDILKNAINLRELSLFKNPINNLPDVVFDFIDNCLPKLKKWLGYYPFIAILAEGENDLIDLNLELVSSKNKGMGIENHYEVILECGNIDIKFDFWEYPIGKANRISVNPEKNNIIGNDIQQLCSQFQAYLDYKYSEVILPNYQAYLDLFAKNPTENIKKRTIDSLIQNDFFTYIAVQEALEKELKSIIIQDFTFEEIIAEIDIDDLIYDESNQTIIISGSHQAVILVNFDKNDIENTHVYTLPFKYRLYLKKETAWGMSSYYFNIDTTSYNRGKIIEFTEEKGHGYIQRIDGEERGIYFHIKQCVDRDYTPCVNDLVVFSIVPSTGKGRIQANDVIHLPSANNKSDNELITENHEYDNGFRIKFKDIDLFFDLDLELVDSEEREMGPENQYHAILEDEDTEVEFDFWEYPVGSANHVSISGKDKDMVENSENNLRHQFQDWLHDSLTDFKTVENALNFFIKNPLTKQKQKIASFLREHFGFFEDKMKVDVRQKIYDKNTLQTDNIDISLSKELNIECFDEMIKVTGNAVAEVEYNQSESNIDNIKDYTTSFNFRFALYLVQDSQLNISDKQRGWVVIEQSLHFEKEANEIEEEDYDSLLEVDFKTPQEALAFFKANPDTLRKDEITDLLLSDNIFFKKVMDIHLSEAISNDFAIADSHSFSIRKITNFKWFSDNNSITFAGEGITSILLENTRNNKIEKAFDEETTFLGELYYNEEYNDWEFEGLFEFPSIKEMLEQSNYEIAQGFKDNGKDWDWWLWIDANEENLNKIRDVTYYLHSTFKEPIRLITDRSTNYKLTTSGWGTFVIKIEINLKSGVIVKLEHQLKFDRQNELFDRPQKALNFFVENLKTTRKDEIIEILLDTPSFLENLLSESIYSELLNFVAGNPEIEETIVEEITKLEFIKRDNEILLVGSGTTSVNSRLEDIKIPEDYKFNFIIRLASNSNSEWELIDNEQNEITLIRNSDSEDYQTYFE